MDRKAILFLLGEGDVKNDYLVAILDRISGVPTQTDMFVWVTGGQDIETIAKGTVLTLLSHKSLALKRAKYLVQPILDQKDDRGFLHSYNSIHPHLLTRDYICGVTLGLIQAAARSDEKIATAIFKLIVEIAFSEADGLAVLASSGNINIRNQIDTVKYLEQTYYRKAFAECTRTFSLLPACRLARGEYQAGQRLYYFGEMLIRRLIFTLQSGLTENAFCRNMVGEHLGWVLRHPSAVKKKIK